MKIPRSNIIKIFIRGFYMKKPKNNIIAGDLRLQSIIRNSIKNGYINTRNPKCNTEDRINNA